MYMSKRKSEKKHVRTLCKRMCVRAGEFIRASVIQCVSEFGFVSACAVVCVLKMRVCIRKCVCAAYVCGMPLSV